jgi:histidyl-tRNA synthetase
MREADHRHARYALILGQDELARGEVAVKPLATDESQTSVPLAEIQTWLQERLAD